MYWAGVAESPWPRASPGSLRGLGGGSTLAELNAGFVGKSLVGIESGYPAPQSSGGAGLGLSQEACELDTGVEVFVINGEGTGQRGAGGLGVAAREGVAGFLMQGVELRASGGRVDPANAPPERDLSREPDGCGPGGGDAGEPVGEAGRGEKGAGDRDLGGKPEEQGSQQPEPFSAGQDEPGTGDDEVCQ